MELTKKERLHFLRGVLSDIGEPAQNLHLLPDEEFEILWTWAFRVFLDVCEYRHSRRAMARPPFLGEAL